MRYFSIKSELTGHFKVKNRCDTQARYKAKASDGDLCSAG